MSALLPTRLAVLVCLLALLALAGGGVAMTAGESPTTLADTDTTTDFAVDSRFATQHAVETDRVRIDIELNADGSAEWRVEFWSVLEDDDTELAFESLQDDIEADPDTYSTEFADRIDDTVDTASQSTGREMTASEFSVTTDRQSLGREYGIVSYSFEWDGFATVDGEAIQAGDAIDGLFLDDDSRLLIRWPADYDLQSVTPEPDDERSNAVLWRGSDTEFLAGEPRLTVSQPLLGVGSGTLAVSLAVAAIALAVVGWLLRRRSSTEATAPADTTAEPDDSTESTTLTSPDVESSSTVTDTADTSPTDSTVSTTDPTDSTEPSHAAEEVSTDDDHSSDSATESDPSPDPDLLSNEEQVMQLLEAHGGRMKQQTVVQELGWTDAKTSKIVSTLREEDKLESFRIGRENVLRMPDDDKEDSSL